MSKYRKKGLFLSIETVGVLVIITAIAAVVIAGIAHLFKMYKVYQISRDISQYSEAVLQFKVSYRYLPGDVPSNKLNASLNNSYLLNDVGSAAFSALPRGYISAESGSALAFRELSLAGLISAPINTTSTASPVSSSTTSSSSSTSSSANIIDTTSTGGCSSLKDLATVKYIPVASWDDNLAWTLGSEPLRTPAKSVTNSDSNLSPIWTSAKIRLILFRPSSTSTTKCVIDLSTVTPGSASTGSTAATNPIGFGAISAVIGSEIANKLSDGNPSTTSSKIVFENNTSGTSACTTATSSTTDITTVKFTNSTDDSPLNGCLMTVGIDGTN